MPNWRWTCYPKLSSRYGMRCVVIWSPINYLDFKGIRITCLVSVGIFDSINTILFDWFHPDFKSRMSFDSEFSPYFNGRNTFEIHRYCFNLNFFREHKKTPWVRFTPTHGVQFSKSFLPGLFIKTNKNPLKQQVNTVSAGFALSPVGWKP